MFELIVMNTGRSYTFPYNGPMETFDIPAHVVRALGFELDKNARGVIAAELRRGRPATWYSGIYVRMI